jgi:hypothetical protein
MNLLAHVTPQDIPLGAAILLIGVGIGAAVSTIVVGYFSRRD